MLEDATMKATGPRLITNFAIVHQFSAKHFAARAKAIEDAHSDAEFGASWNEIRTYTTAAILSSAAALEAFINECFQMPNGALRAGMPNFEADFWGEGAVSWWTPLLQAMSLRREPRGGIVWIQILAKYERALKLQSLSP